MHDLKKYCEVIFLSWLLLNIRPKSKHLLAFLEMKKTKRLSVFNNFLYLSSIPFLL